MDIRYSFSYPVSLDLDIGEFELQPHSHNTSKTTVHGSLRSMHECLYNYTVNGMVGHGAQKTKGDPNKGLAGLGHGPWAWSNKEVPKFSG